MCMRMCADPRKGYRSGVPSWTIADLPTAAPQAYPGYRVNDPTDPVRGPFSHYSASLQAVSSRFQRQDSVSAMMDKEGICPHRPPACQPYLRAIITGGKEPAMIRRGL